MGPMGVGGPPDSGEDRKEGASVSPPLSTHNASPAPTCGKVLSSLPTVRCALDAGHKWGCTPDRATPSSGDPRLEKLRTMLVDAVTHQCPNGPPCEGEGDDAPLEHDDWCGVCLLVHDIRALLFPAGQKGGAT